MLFAFCIADPHTLQVQRRADNESQASPTDKDVADMIDRMEQILNTTDENFNFEFEDYLHIELSSDDDSLTQTTPHDIIVELSINQSNDRMKKRCFNELVRHSKSEKKRLRWIEKLVTKQQRMKLLSKHLLTWKSINRMIQVKEAMLSCKIGRATSNKFRRSFVEWKRLMLLRREQLSKVDRRLRRKVCRRVIAGMIQRKEMSLLAIERAEDRFAWKCKAKIAQSWRAMIRKNKEAEKCRRSRVMRRYFVAWSSLLREGGPSDCDPEQAPPDGESQQVSVIQTTTATEDDTLLQPLRKSRRRLPRSCSTPKIMTHEGRMQRKEVFRFRLEQAVIAKKKLLDAERHSQEQRELRVHNEFLRKKAQEKEEKERNAKASRLAVLHYRFSLQKRFFFQWTRIFGINGWNERKAVTFLRDVTYEKCFSIWHQFSKKKPLRFEKRHHLAVDFRQTNLLAKAFASLEESVKYSHHLHDEATSQLSTLRKRAILREWQRETLVHVKERDSNEIEATRAYQTFVLRRAVYGWKAGVDMSREERRIEKVVDEKYAAMMEWLEASRNDNDPN